MKVIWQQLTYQMRCRKLNPEELFVVKIFTAEQLSISFGATDSDLYRSSSLILTIEQLNWGEPQTEEFVQSVYLLE